MTKTKISKIALLLLLTLVLATCVTTRVFADNNGLNLFEQVDGGNSGGSNNSGVENFDGDFNTPKPEDGTTGGDSGAPNNVTPNNGTSNDNKETNTNTNTYGEPEIPYAGPETTVLMVIAFITFGIIGIYTFVKLSDYSNV